MIFRTVVQRLTRFQRLKASRGPSAIAELLVSLRCDLFVVATGTCVCGISDSLTLVWDPASLEWGRRSYGTYV